MATVYAVASAKGGVGKTTTTAALATLLAEAGADVVAVDADIGMANLAGALGVEVGETTVHDVLAGRAEPDEAVHDGPAGLRVLPGETDLDAYAEADPAGIRDVVAAFDDADYVFLDAGAGLSHDSTLPLALADETLLITTAERGALGDTEKTRELTERLGGTVAGAALTRVDPDAPASPLVDDLLDTTVIGRIPEDPAVPAAGAAGEPLVLHSPTTPATRAYRDLTHALTGHTIPRIDENEHPETDDASESGSEEPSDEDEPDAETTAEEATDEESTDDILVADPEPAGVTEAGDDEDIIVAETEAVEDEADAESETVEDEDEGPDEIGAVTPDDAAAEELAETAADADGELTDGEAEADEPGGVTPDDAAAEGPADSPDGETGGELPDADAEADETGAVAPADTAAEEREQEPEHEPESESDPESESESEPEHDDSVPEAEPDRDPDDELAGSVPFRDDDTGTAMQSTIEEAEDEEKEDTKESKKDDDEDGGFFSRLFGR